MTAGEIIGHDKIVTAGISPAELDQIFRPLMNAVGAVKPEQQKEAAQKVEALKQETAKGIFLRTSCLARPRASPGALRNSPS